MGRGSLLHALFFDYFVQAEDRDPDGISIAPDALTLNGGSIRSLAGEDADLDLSVRALGDQENHKVDGSQAVTPEVDSVVISSRPQNGDTYGVWEKITIWVGFTTPIEVTGSPQLALTVGSDTRSVALTTLGGRGSLLHALFFDYFVQAEDRDPDGISIAPDALTLNGGSIRSLAGEDADLDLSVRALGDQENHKVDGSQATAPEIDWVWISSRPQNGDTYGVWEKIKIRVRFTTPIEVTGSPQLAVTVGSDTRPVALQGWSGSTLFFDYFVQAEDRDPDGISIAPDALTLNGGSIRSLAGEDADLDLGGHAMGDQANHKLDGSFEAPAKPIPFTLEDPEDSKLPGHLDLLSVTVSAVGQEALKFTFETRGAIPNEGDPAVNSLSYRVFIDLDRPFMQGVDFDDPEFSWDIGGSPQLTYFTSGPGISPRIEREGNTIALTASMQALEGKNRFAFFVDLIDWSTSPLKFDQSKAIVVSLDAISSP